MSSPHKFNDYSIGIGINHSPLAQSTAQFQNNIIHNSLKSLFQSHNHSNNNNMNNNSDSHIAPSNKASKQDQISKLSMKLEKILLDENNSNKTQPQSQFHSHLQSQSQSQGPQSQSLSNKSNAPRTSSLSHPKLVRSNFSDLSIDSSESKLSNVNSNFVYPLATNSQLDEKERMLLGNEERYSTVKLGNTIMDEFMSPTEVYSHYTNLLSISEEMTQLSYNSDGMDKSFENASNVVLELIHSLDSIDKGVDAYVVNNSKYFDMINDYYLKLLNRKEEAENERHVHDEEREKTLNDTFNSLNNTSILEEDEDFENAGIFEDNHSNNNGINNKNRHNNDNNNFVLEEDEDINIEDFNMYLVDKVNNYSIDLNLQNNLVNILNNSKSLIENDFNNIRLYNYNNEIKSKSNHLYNCLENLVNSFT